jgi:hypothetical protein
MSYRSVWMAWQALKIGGNRWQHKPFRKNLKDPANRGQLRYTDETTGKTYLFRLIPFYWVLTLVLAPPGSTEIVGSPHSELVDCIVTAFIQRWRYHGAWLPYEARDLPCFIGPVLT